MLRLIEAERFLVGAAVLDKDVAERVALLPDELFTVRVVRDEILPAIRSLVARGVQPTPGTVLAACLASENLESWISDAIASVDSPANADYYATLLRDMAVLRRFKRLIARIERKEEGPPLETIRREVESAASLFAGTGSATLLADAATGLEALEEPPVVKTGVSGLDSVLSLRKGHLLFIAATPGQGKTSFAAQIADEAAEVGLTVLFVSLEMSPEEIARRIASRHGLTAPGSIREFLKGRDIYYDTAHTPHGIRERIRESSADLVIVDYIGLMSPDKETGSRVTDIASISRALKITAMAEGCPIIALSQLNRKAAEGSPQMWHLRDSGALEADADAVLLLYEEDDRRYVRLAKNRHGPVGVWEVLFDPGRCTFR